jgi:hypothetical protein
MYLRRGMERMEIFAGNKEKGKYKKEKREFISIKI